MWLRLTGWFCWLSSPVLKLYLRLFMPRYSRFLRLDPLAARAFRRGNYVKATELASEALRLAEQYTDDWNYGNVIHDSHQILGMVALQMGDIAQAKISLLAAGGTPGSPQLDSFGPNIVLARELLKLGERQVVKEYLDLVAVFWAAEKDERFREVESKNKQLLQEWKVDIDAGRVPDYYLWKQNL